MDGRKELKEFEEILFKWAEILKMEVKDILNLVLSYFKRYESISVDGYTSLQLNFENPDNFKSFEKIMPKGSELIKLVKDKKSEEYKTLKSIAELLDKMGNENFHVFILSGEYLFIDSDNKIMIHPEAVDEIIVSDEKTINEKLRNKYFYKLPVRDIMINYNIINENLERHAISFFLTELFFPEVPFMKVPKRTAIEYIDMWHDFATPEFKELAEKILIRNSGGINFTCTQILDGFIDSLTKSVRAETDYRDNLHELDYGIRRGRYKKTNTHSEDEYEIIHADKSNIHFLMIADGVSTATLGSGEKMSKQIRNIIRYEKESEIRKFLNDIKTDNYELFFRDAKKFLSQLIVEINTKTVEILNAELKNKNMPSASVEHPMSSTLILGIAAGNWFVFTHLGDSEIIVYNNDRIFIMNTPHINKRERIIEELSKNTVIHENKHGDDEISRVVPLTVRKNDVFESIDDPAGQIDFINFFLKENDIVIAATDGLLSCFGKNDRNTGLNELKSFINKNNSLSTKDLVKKILDQADEISIDDVSMIMIKINSIIKEKPVSIEKEKTLNMNPQNIRNDKTVKKEGRKTF